MRNERKHMRLATVFNNDVLKRINKLAAPILLSYLTGFIFTLADQAIIGRTSLECVCGGQRSFKFIVCNNRDIRNNLPGIKHQRLKNARRK